MKTLSMFACLFLVIYGFYTLVFNGNTAGFFVMMVGSLAFLIITARTEKVKGYNPKNFMNR